MKKLISTQIKQIVIVLLAFGIVLYFFNIVCAFIATLVAFLFVPGTYKTRQEKEILMTVLFYSFLAIVMAIVFASFDVIYSGNKLSNISIAASVLFVIAIIIFNIFSGENEIIEIKKTTLLLLALGQQAFLLSGFAVIYYRLIPLIK